MGRYRTLTETANELYEFAIERAAYWREFAIETLTEGGAPPLYAPEENEQLVYENLVALRNAGSPAYRNSPQAVADLERLSKLYGPPLLTPAQSQQEFARGRALAQGGTRPQLLKPLPPPA